MASDPKIVTTEGWKSSLPATQISFANTPPLTAIENQTAISEMLTYIDTSYAAAIASIAPIPVFYDEFHNALNKEWHLDASSDVSATTTFQSKPTGIAKLETTATAGSKLIYDFDGFKTFRADKKPQLEWIGGINSFTKQKTLVSLEGAVGSFGIEFDPHNHLLDVASVRMYDSWSIGDTSYITLNTPSAYGTLQVGDVLVLGGWDVNVYNTSHHLSFDGIAVVTAISVDGLTISIDSHLHTGTSGTYYDEAAGAGKWVGMCNYYLKTTGSAGTKYVRPIGTNVFKVVSASAGSNPNPGNATIVVGLTNCYAIPSIGNVITVIHENNYEYDGSGAPYYPLAHPWGAYNTIITNIVHYTGNLYNIYYTADDTGIPFNSSIPFTRSMAVVFPKKMTVKVIDPTVLGIVEFDFGSVDNQVTVGTTYIPSDIMQPRLYQETLTTTNMLRSADIDSIKIYQNR